LKTSFRIPPLLLNAIAGIAFGVLNETWVAWVTIPFIWGILYCIYIAIVGQRQRDDFVAKARGKRILGIPPQLTFYLVEYGKALIISLIFSAIAGSIKDLF
jgi:hypothetical protein